MKKYDENPQSTGTAAQARRLPVRYRVVKHGMPVLSPDGELVAVHDLYSIPRRGYKKIVGTIVLAVLLLLIFFSKTIYRYNLPVYVPAGATGGQADSIMVLMDETFTEAYVKNALKSIGVRDASYDFLNLSRLAGAFDGRFSVAWKSALLAAVLYAILLAGGKLVEKLRFFRDKIQELYFKELFVRYRRDLWKAMGGLIVVAAGITVTLALSLQILAACLALQELTPITGELAAGVFGHKLLWLRDYQLPGEVLFWACIGLTILDFLCALFRRAKKAENRMYNDASDDRGP